MDQALLQQLRKHQDTELGLRNALDATDTGYWSWIRGEPMKWDGHMLKLFGIGREEVPQSLESFLLLLDSASQERAIEAFDAACEEHATIDLHLVAERTGQTLKFTGRAYLLPEVQASALSGLCHAASLETSPDSEATTMELANFASVASHDLREPLRAISSYLSLLQERYPDSLDERAKRYIKSACDGADRMRRLIEDLLSYARMDSETEAPGPVALAEVMGETVNMLAPAISEKGADIQIRFERPVYVLADRTSLVRLFMNLLNNAIKFHDEGSRPEVRIELEDGDKQGAPGFWIISVIDNGIGIDPEHQSILFNLFQRLHTRDEFDGSGIGLAACKKITDRLGGRIGVDSKGAQGCRFYVHLKKARP